jgi:hypothetical protein
MYTTFEAATPMLGNTEQARVLPVIRRVQCR